MTQAVLAFNEQLELDGLILTKLDSDTRGGALLSAKMVTGKPVKFLGVGEKLDRLEEFRPEGMAQRILGMGDIVGLVSEAMEKFDQEEQAKLQAKMEKGTFTLDDFMSQMTQIKRLGPMSKVIGMIPGMDQLTKQFGQGEGEIEGQMSRMKVGQTIKFGVLRGKKGDALQEISVTTGEMPKRPNTAKRWYAEDLGFTSREVVFTDTYARRLKPDAKGVIVALVRQQSAAESAKNGAGTAASGATKSGFCAAAVTCRSRARCPPRSCAPARTK